MSKRKLLKSISYDMAHKFESRNNGLVGLWALGPILGCAIEHNVDEIKFDLISETSSPTSKRMKPIVRNYLDILNHQLSARNVNRSMVSNAFISVEFDMNESRPSTVSKLYTEHPFTIKVTIEDENNKNHEGKVSGWCFAA